jgi:hypothetical protein
MYEEEESLWWYKSIKPIAIDTPKEWIEEAKEIRKLRSGMHNQFSVKSTDKQWVGDLVEIVFHRYLSDMGVPHKWNDKKPVGVGDIEIGAIATDAKGSKRKRDSLITDPGIMHESHLDDKPYINQYLFGSYHLHTNETWLIGGISRANALKVARRAGPGDRIDYWVIEEGRFAYVRYYFCTPFDKWLQEVINTCGFRLSELS